MTCSVCGKSIANKNALWTHMVFRHPEEAENVDMLANIDVHKGGFAIKKETPSERMLDLQDEEFREKDRIVLSEKYLFNAQYELKKEVSSNNVKTCEENDNGRTRNPSGSSSSSSIVIVDPVFENSGSDQSYFELPGYELEEAAKSVETSNLYAKIIREEELDLEYEINIEKAVKTSKLYSMLIRKEELEIEYENNIENAVLDLAFETVTNDAIEDHIDQLEEYLKQIQKTFSILSLG